jgi:putative ABC transport system ATP-binding protein
VIILNNIRKSYFVGERELPILKGINLEIKQGEFVILMGVSGSGKTTLMNIIGLLDKQTEGEFYFMDTSVEGLDDEALAGFRNRHIGFVFQQFFLLPYLNAIENVLIPMVYSTKEIKHPRDKARHLLRKFNLAERTHNRPSQLSGGEQQRVAIARALINDPDLILADEPTGALDSKTGNEIMELFRMLNEDGKTIMVVTHDPKLASYGRRLIRIEDGTISEDITT